MWKWIGLAKGRNPSADLGFRTQTNLEQVGAWKTLPLRQGSGLVIISRPLVLGAAHLHGESECLTRSLNRPDKGGGKEDD